MTPKMDPRWSRTCSRWLQDTPTDRALARTSFVAFQMGPFWALLMRFIRPMSGGKVSYVYAEGWSGIDIKYRYRCHRYQLSVSSIAGIGIFESRYRYRGSRRRRDAPRWPQDGPRWPPDGPKMAFMRLKMALVMCYTAPRWPS